MSIAVNIISAVIKSVVGDKVGSGLIKELTGISIDGISGKGVSEINNFINNGKFRIERVLSEEKNDYVVSEIKDLLSKVDITDEVLRQCKYNNMILEDFMWRKYATYKNMSTHIEYEGEIKVGLFKVAEVLTKVMLESEDFSNKMLIQISNAVDDANAEVQKVSDNLKKNFSKIDDNSQLVLSILLMILEQIQKMNMQANETESRGNEAKKFQNDKKKEYIENWNSRLFLHIDNDENPITLADAFIIPDYEIHKSIKRIGFSINDSLDQIIKKFINYKKTTTMLIAGVPGIGKSSITSWIANKYKNDDRVVILRFRDFKKVILEKTLLDAICNELGCEDVNLDNKILILDGFDEMKALNVRDVLLDTLFNDIKDFDNFKCIITSRLGYINAYQFHSILKLKEFDIKRVEDFVKIITGDVLQKRERIEPNLEVLGIPVILYMAIMSNIDISENPTKPELYNRIFAEKGGIFDRFYDGEVEYSKGKQILRKPANIIKYLEFLQEVAFKMFEKGDLSLKEEEYQVPELEFQGDLVSILEFPIKYLFEKTVYNIEFIHKSIYEYFVAEYIFTSLFKVINESKQSVAGVLGKILPKRLISSEVLEFLAYKIKKTELNYKFDIIINAFQLMLQDGMTYYTSECYKNAIECEMQVFANMLEILHLWNNEPLEFISPIINYIEYNKKLHLNLAYVNLKNKNLVGVNLNEANLKNANLGSSELNEIKLCKSNLVGTNLKMAKLNNSKLSNANLKNADLCGASLCDVDFENADLSDADLTYTNLKRANLKNANLSNADLSAAVLTAANLSGINLCNAKLRGAELDEKQVISLEKIYNLQGVKIYLNETKEKIDYKEFCNRRILVK